MTTVWAAVIALLAALPGLGTDGTVRDRAGRIVYQVPPRFEQPVTAQPGHASSNSVAWRQLLPDFPDVREGASMVYDSANNRLVVFGGRTGFLEIDHLYNDVIEFDLGTRVWHRLLPTGVPPAPRALHSAVYDAARQRMVVFGGTAGLWPDYNDVWTLNLVRGQESWQRLVPTGDTIAKRIEHSAIVDVAHDRMVVFGGLTAGLSDANDVHALDLAGIPAWHRLAPSGDTIAGRYGQAAFYDAMHERMLVFGGYGLGTFFSDVHALSLAPDSEQWTRLAVAGIPPVGRTRFAAWFDPGRELLTVFAGEDPGVRTGSPPLGDIAVLDLGGSTWLSVGQPDTTPPNRLWTTSCGVGASAALWGGAADVIMNDLWFLDLTRPAFPRWDRYPRNPSLPRSGVAAAFDPVARRMVVWGGDNTAYFPPQPARELSFLDVAPEEWSTIIPDSSGPDPYRRRGSSLVFDTRNRRFLMLGGYYYGYPYLTDLFSLSFDSSGAAVWQNLGQDFPAPFGGLAYHTAVYDPFGEQMIVYGGNTDSGIRPPDTYAFSTRLDSPGWHKLETQGPAPTSAVYHVAVFDTRNRRKVIVEAAGTFILDLTGTPTWQSLGLPPFGPVTSGAAAFDPRQGRMLVFGGYQTRLGAFTDQLWSLDLFRPGQERWLEAIVEGMRPPAVNQPAAVWDSVADRILVFGGSIDRRARNNTYTIDSIALGIAEPAPEPGPAVGILPSLVRSGTRVEFSFRAPVKTIAIHDATGILVRRLDVASGGRATWDGRDHQGRLLPAGVYFLFAGPAGLRGRLTILR